MISTGGVGMRSTFATKGLPKISNERVRISRILVCITTGSYLVSQAFQHCSVFAWGNTTGCEVVSNYNGIDPCFKHFVLFAIKKKSLPPATMRSLSSPKRLRVLRMIASASSSSILRVLIGSARLG